MKVYLTREFDRFAAKNAISDQALRDAVARAESGLVDAHLGGPIIKQRVARAGQGRSRGHRVVLVFRRGALAVYVHGFSKSAKANLSRAEQEAFGEFGKIVIALSGAELSALEKRQKWRRLDFGQSREKVSE